MSAWLRSMAAGSVLIYGLYGLYCARQEKKPALRKNAWGTAALALLLSALFGTVLARAGYALLMQELDFEYEGLAALEGLLDFDFDLLSFLCGAAGVLLGTLLANRLTRKGHTAEGMDAFAPFGALLAALFRMGELFFGSYGMGSALPENSGLAFFPFAVQVTADGGYSYWVYAVCVLSAVFALIWAGVSLARFTGRGRTGLNLTLTLFFLALPQVLCESLRKRGMFWLFVHVEELLCGLILLAVVLFWILKSGKGVPAARRWMPMAVIAAGIGLLVATEFAIDGKIFDLPVGLCYAVMCVILCAMGWAGAVAAGRWNAEGSGR